MCEASITLHRGGPPVVGRKQLMISSHAICAEVTVSGTQGSKDVVIPDLMTEQDSDRLSKSFQQAETVDIDTLFKLFNSEYVKYLVNKFKREAANPVAAVKGSIDYYREENLFNADVGKVFKQKILVTMEGLHPVSLFDLNKEAIGRRIKSDGRVLDPSCQFHLTRIGSAPMIDTTIECATETAIPLSMVVDGVTSNYAGTRMGVIAFSGEKIGDKLIPIHRATTFTTKAGPLVGMTDFDGKPFGSNVITIHDDSVMQPKVLMKGLLHVFPNPDDYPTINMDPMRAGLKDDSTTRFTRAMLSTLKNTLGAPTLRNSGPFVDYYVQLNDKEEYPDMKFFDALICAKYLQSNDWINIPITTVFREDNVTTGTRWVVASNIKLQESIEAAMETFSKAEDDSTMEASIRAPIMLKDMLFCAVPLDLPEGRVPDSIKTMAKVEITYFIPLTRRK